MQQVPLDEYTDTNLLARFWVVTRRVNCLVPTKKLDSHVLQFLVKPRTNIETLCEPRIELSLHRISLQDWPCRHQLETGR
jgi:hypothetical protein